MSFLCYEEVTSSVIEEGEVYLCEGGQITGICYCQVSPLVHVCVGLYVTQAWRHVGDCVSCF